MGWAVFSCMQGHQLPAMAMCRGAGSGDRVVAGYRSHADRLPNLPRCHSVHLTAGVTSDKRGMVSEWPKPAEPSPKRHKRTEGQHVQGLWAALGRAGALCASFSPT